MNARISEEIPENGKIKITPEMLKDGTVLCGLVIRFINNRNHENMFALLSCLRDSNVFVPCEVNMDGRDLDIGGKGDNPIIFPVHHKMQIKPQLYKATNGGVYMPFYTRQENAKPSELRGASLINLPYLQLVGMLHDNEACTGFVVDPKLYNVVLDQDAIRVSAELPSRLSRR
ncbi:MAG: SseB family protein [Clostridia bacterium]|nr:SseB family protein [Clostridia bacterium]